METYRACQFCPKALKLAQKHWDSGAPRELLPKSSLGLQSGGRDRKEQPHSPGPALCPTGSKEVCGQVRPTVLSLVQGDSITNLSGWLRTHVLRVLWWPCCLSCGHRSKETGGREKVWYTSPDGHREDSQSLRAMNLEFQVASEAQLRPYHRVSHFARCQQVPKSNHKKRPSAPQP